MNITEVRAKLLGGRSDRLRAFCSIIIDDEFAVHDLRVIDGHKGLFVAMPSRKLSDNCPSCGGKNNLKAKFCSECGHKLGEERSGGAKGRDKLHVDVAHPINPECREMIQSTVLKAFEDEAKRSGKGLELARAYKREQLDELAEEYGPVEAEESPAETVPEPKHEEVERYESRPTCGEVEEPSDAGGEVEEPSDAGGEVEEPSDAGGEEQGEEKVGGFGDGIL